MTRLPVSAPIFCKISLALEEITALVGRLEHAVLQTCGAESGASQRAAEFQDFDLILQSLEELARLTASLGENGIPETPKDQASKIAQMRLAWLRELMGERTDQAASGTPKISLF